MAFKALNEEKNNQRRHTMLRAHVWRKSGRTRNGKLKKVTEKINY